MSTTLQAPSYAAGQDDYIYCQMSEAEGPMRIGTIYYSEVFVGDYSFTLGPTNAFYEHVKANAPDLAFWNAVCFFEKSHGRAERRLVREAQEHRRAGYRVAHTHWTPQVGARAVDASFATQPIRDFRIAVPVSPYDVEVCVRDHQCEDGDRVRVSVNGTALLSGEILNAWNCRSVSLSEGRHEVELYAVNGTGYKGNCSYADGNTGELRVTGKASETQSWRHRGGQGSRASIHVVVQ